MTSKNITIAVVAVLVIAGIVVGLIFGLREEAGPPTLSPVSPSQGGQGATFTVTITGTDFTGATEISFGAEVTVNSFTVDSSTQITANITIAETASQGARDVSVITPGGTATLASAFTVLQTPATIKVGVTVGLTGAFGSLGTQTIRGYEIAVEDINAAGGVYVALYGKKIPIELIVLDDESSTTKVVDNLNTLKTVHNVVAYLGTAGSTVHAAAVPVAEANKIPYIAGGFGLVAPHTLGYRYIFAPFIKMDTIAYESFKMLDTLPADDWTGADGRTYSGRNNLKIAIFEIAAGGGDEFANAVVQAASARGWASKVVSRQTHSPAATFDFTTLVQGAKAAGANVLFSFPTPPQGVNLITAMKANDWDVQHNYMVRAPDLITWSPSTGLDGNGVINPMGWHYAAPWPGVAELNARYNELYGTVADPLTGPAYACVQILADSIERAGTLDPTAIRDAMADFDGMTVAGPFTFNADGTGNGIWMLWQIRSTQEDIAAGISGRAVVWPLSVTEYPDWEPADWLPIPPWSAR